MDKGKFRIRTKSFTYFFKAEGIMQNYVDPLVQMLFRDNKFDEIKVQIKLQAYFTLSVTFDPLRKEKPSDALRVRPDLSSPADRARPKTSSNVLNLLSDIDQKHSKFQCFHS